MWDQSTFKSRVNLAPLLRQNIHLLNTLPDGLYIISFSTLCDSILTILSSLWALKTVSPSPVWWFFPRLHWPVLNWKLKGNLLKVSRAWDLSRQLSLFIALFFLCDSSPLYQEISLDFILQILANLSSCILTVSQFRKSVGLCLGSPLFCVAWKSWGNNFIWFVSLISDINALCWKHCHLHCVQLF